MFQAGDRARLAQEILHVLLRDAHLQDFERRLCPQVDVVAQVDISEAPVSEDAQQTILAKLLSDSVVQITPHGATKSRPFSLDYSTTK